MLSTQLAHTRLEQHDCFLQGICLWKLIWAWTSHATGRRQAFKWTSTMPYSRGGEIDFAPSQRT
jgi:hypothetical protein